MYELISHQGATFITRSDSVDRDAISWMYGSRFVSIFRALNPAPEDAILDLGSHIGSFAIIAALEKTCMVIGCEPDPVGIRLARINALLNHVEDRVSFYSYAIGKEAGHASLFEATETWGHTMIASGGPWNQLTGTHTEVPVTTLEGALRLTNGRRCALVKVNIEGAEQEMFEGASSDTLRAVQTYVGELHEDLKPGTMESIVQRLEECDFQVSLHDRSESRSILEAHRR